MTRTAQALWKGDLKTGSGIISTQSKALESAQYSFKTRFEEGVGTNPEELIAAAHAGCFSMALSLALQSAGHPPTSVDTDAQVTFEQVDGNWTITKSHLTSNATVPGLALDEFQKIAADAKANCPISRVLNAEISLDASLV